MYLQITNRCNMECDHCGMGCTRMGEDMSLRTFRAALDLADPDEGIMLGGGEPTLHPKFEIILLEAIAKHNVWCITNGSVTNRALMLAKLAKKDVIVAELSTDYFHDSSMVAEEVVEAFGDMVRDVTRDGTRDPLPAGRAIDYLGWEDPPKASDCICPETFVRPNGDIHQCGCINSPKIGDVWNGYDTEVRWECYLYKEEE